MFWLTHPICIYRLVVLVNRLMTNPLYDDSMKENQANVICNQEHVSSGKCIAK